MKKSWYKKWWVWVIAVIGFFTIGNVLNPSDDKAASRSNHTTHKTATTKNATNHKSSNDQDKIFEVGQTATLDNATLTVNTVKTSDSFNAGISTPKQGNQFYTVNVTIKNTGNKKIHYNPFDFKVNSNGNQTDFTEIDTDDHERLESGELAAGGSVTGSLTGQAKKDGSVQLVYTPSFFSERHLIFKLH